MNGLTLPPQVIDGLFAHARAEFPRECCGVIVGPPTVPADWRFVAFDNLQDEMHRLEPERFPRDARTAYYLDPLKLDQLVTAEQERGGDLIAIAHSHPGHPSYFSAMDRAAATPFGFPTWAQAYQLVVSVIDREVRDLKAFAWEEPLEDFVEKPIYGLPSLPGPLSGQVPEAEV